MAYADIGQKFIELARKQQEQNEANARARTFNPVKALGGLATSILTANPAPLAMSVVGEGVRSATGSEGDVSGLASDLGTALMGRQRMSNLANIKAPKAPKGFYVAPKQNIDSVTGSVYNTYELKPIPNYFTKPKTTKPKTDDILGDLLGSTTGVASDPLSIF